MKENARLKAGSRREKKVIYIVLSFYRQKKIVFHDFMIFSEVQSPACFCLPSPCSTFYANECPCQIGLDGCDWSEGGAAASARSPSPLSFPSV